MSSNLAFMDKIFRPQSIAIVGASSKPARLGFKILHHLIYSGYQGRIFPIHPSEKEIFNYPVYASILAVPEEITIDLVVIVVRSDRVINVIKECGQRNITAAVVITAGFGEMGEEGRKLEEKLISTAKEQNVRLVGPNCMGVLSTAVTMSVMIWPFKLDDSKKGKVAFISQSGNLGTLGCNLAFSKRIGISKFVSAGNATDIHIEEYFEYFGQDPDTKVICAYIEGVQDGPRFVEIAKKISKEKPILIVKGGRTEAGTKAASSHTGSISGSDKIYQTVFDHTGIIRFDTFEEMFDFAAVYLNQPLPTGDRVALLTNGGGWGVIAADACGMFDFKLDTVTEDTYRKIAGLLPPFWVPNNPIDMIAAFDPKISKQIAEFLLQDPEVDSLMLLGLDVSSFLSKTLAESSYISKEHAEQFWTSVENDKMTLVHICNLSKKYNKPVFNAGLLSTKDSPSLAKLLENGTPTFSSVDQLAKIYSKLLWYSKWLEIQGVT